MNRGAYAPMFFTALYDAVREGEPMLDVTVLCVGRLKERYYADAAAEYIKRLSPFCRLTVTELPEAKRSRTPSEGETEAALLREAESIRGAIPKGAAVIALCIEGTELGSREFAGRIRRLASGGASKLCFLIGGSDGLHRSVKESAALRLSMSPMTFPHHLARVMLLEQLYRAFSILNGGKYHK